MKKVPYLLLCAHDEQSHLDVHCLQKYFCFVQQGLIGSSVVPR